MYLSGDYLAGWAATMSWSYHDGRGRCKQLV